MHDGERDVDEVVHIVFKRLEWVFHDIRAVSVAHQYDPLAFFQERGDILVRFDVADCLPDVHLVVFGDINRDDIVFFRVHRLDCLDCRDNGNLVLYALSAE